MTLSKWASRKFGKTLRIKSGINKPAPACVYILMCPCTCAVCGNDERDRLPDEAVGCCEHPVLMNESTTTGMGEAGIWTALRPHLKQTHTGRQRRRH